MRLVLTADKENGTANMDIISYKKKKNQLCIRPHEIQNPKGRANSKKSHKREPNYHEFFNTKEYTDITLQNESPNTQPLGSNKHLQTKISTTMHSHCGWLIIVRLEEIPLPAVLATNNRHKLTHQ